MSVREQPVATSDGTTLRTWNAGEAVAGLAPVVMLHGGPGLPDYLSPVAAMIADLSRVHRYDQRGVGGSPWTGTHTIERHTQDVVDLLDAWGYERAVLVGHSYGTNIACDVVLANPDRVAGIVYVAGPYVGSWREGTRATELARRTPAEQARLEELEQVDDRTRTAAEETELLTLAWLTDHADLNRARGWARQFTTVAQPVNWAMNHELNAAKKVVPLDDRVDELRALLPRRTTIIGGAGDPRPAHHLVDLADRLGCDVTILDDAGHHPWLERPGEFRTALRDAVRRLL